MDNDIKSMSNYERWERWAKSFVEMLEKEAKSSQSETVELNLGYSKKKKYKILRENLIEIVRYCKYLGASKFIKPVSIATVANLLLYFAGHIGKPFKEVKKEDVEKFFEEYLSSKSQSYNIMFRRVLKPFFRWLYGYDKKKGYPEVVDWIQTNVKRNNKKLPEVLELEEIEKMIKACDNMRDRAIVSVLYESGVRASELLGLKIGDVHFDEYGAYLIVKGKTGERRIRLISSVLDLKSWLNVHPRKDDPNAPLFCSLSPNRKGKPMREASLNYKLKEIAKKCGIQKNVYPHLFRHTRATHLAKYLTEQELKIYFGWRPNSGVASVYVHLSGADIDNKILAVNGIKKEENIKPTTISPIKCPKCGELNSIGNKFCQKCGSPLDIKTIEKIEAVRKIVSEVTMFIFEKMKERKIGEEDLDNIIKEWYENRERC